MLPTESQTLLAVIFMAQCALGDFTSTTGTDVGVALKGTATEIDSWMA